ncbi:MAG: serine hydrolase [Gemmatimonadetes bacterium]|nr:serine hydrolase [Gemmatimonadota bacterium]
MIRAFEAGTDILLMPADPTSAIAAMTKAVESGRISMARLDRSVAKILALKVKMGLFQQREVDLAKVPDVVGTAASQAIAADITSRALVLLKDSLGTVDALRAAPRKVALVSIADVGSTLGGTLATDLRAAGYTVTAVRVSTTEPTPKELSAAGAAIDGAESVILATSARWGSYSGVIGLAPATADLLKTLTAKKPAVLISFGSPYIISQVPTAASFVIAWNNSTLAEKAVAQALSGLLAGCSHGPPSTTPLPVSATLATRLAPAAAVLDSAIRAGAAPGAVLAVSIRGERFVYGTGRLGLDDATRPDGRTLYDMASLTKVITLTTLAMMAVDDGRLDLDAPVVQYLPDFARGSGNKTAVRVRDLLLHDSGLPPGRPLWLETIVRAGGILRTVTTDLSAPPGTRMVYSDLGAITLTAILEQLYGERIDRLFATRVTKPARPDPDAIPPANGMAAADRTDREGPLARSCPPWRSPR